MKYEVMKYEVMKYLMKYAVIKMKKTSFKDRARPELTHLISCAC